MDANPSPGPWPLSKVQFVPSSGYRHAISGSPRVRGPRRNSRGGGLVRRAPPRARGRLATTRRAPRPFAFRATQGEDSRGRAAGGRRTPPRSRHVVRRSALGWCDARSSRPRTPSRSSRSGSRLTVHLMYTWAVVRCGRRRGSTIRPRGGRRTYSPRGDPCPLFRATSWSRFRTRLPALRHFMPAERESGRGFKRYRRSRQGRLAGRRSRSLAGSACGVSLYSLTSGWGRDWVAGPVAPAHVSPTPTSTHRRKGPIGAARSAAAPLRGRPLGGVAAGGPRGEVLLQGKGPTAAETPLTQTVRRSRRAPRKGRG